MEKNKTAKGPSWPHHGGTLPSYRRLCVGVLMTIYAPDLYSLPELCLSLCSSSRRDSVSLWFSLWATPTPLHSCLTNLCTLSAPHSPPPVREPCPHSHMHRLSHQGRVYRRWDEDTCSLSKINIYRVISNAKCMRSKSVFSTANHLVPN